MISFLRSSRGKDLTFKLRERKLGKVFSARNVEEKKADGNFKPTIRYSNDVYSWCEASEDAKLLAKYVLLIVCRQIEMQLKMQLPRSEIPN